MRHKGNLPGYKEANWNLDLDLVLSGPHVAMLWRMLGSNSDSQGGKINCHSSTCCVAKKKHLRHKM